MNPAAGLTFAVGLLAGSVQRTPCSSSEGCYGFSGAVAAQTKDCAAENLTALANDPDDDDEPAAAG
jgi:hypothetical protein